MFVLNDVTHDSRVLREAASLGAAGHRVTVVGRQRPGVTEVSRDSRDGFVVMLVPYPEGWRYTGPIGRAEALLGFYVRRIPAAYRALRKRRRLLAGALVAAVARRFPTLQRKVGLRRHVRTWIRLRPVRRLASRFLDAAARLKPRAQRLVGRGRLVQAQPVRAGTAGAEVARKQPPASMVPPPPLKASQRAPSNSATLWLRQWWYGILAWAESAASAAPTADVWHAHDLSGLPAALAAQRARGGAVVYDSHELYLESATHAKQPRWARWLMAMLEGRWARRATAVIAVNDAIGGVLQRRYRLERVVVVHNCPPLWQPRADAAGHIRAATGLRSTSVVALYHGRFAPHRGLEQMAAALLAPGLEDVHGVYLGYGESERMLDALRMDPRFNGRIHVLPAVAPDALLDWLNDADVEVMPIQPSTLNHRLSTPNKLFEAIGAGVPVVVPDFPGMKRIVLEHGVGATCNPTDPLDVARAIREVLDRSPADRQAMRERCFAAARTQFNWEAEASKLVALYDELSASSRALQHDAAAGD
jgi:glycosyltransferase involved in cell wall biosynthesis